MSIEQKGPGGVSNSYGVREVKSRENYKTDSTYQDVFGGDGVAVTAQTNPLTGKIAILGPGSIPLDGRLSVGADLVPSFERSPSVSAVAVMDLPNPYPTQANAPCHPSVLFFPQGWNGYRYWLAFTPYPGYDSTYENPCVVASNDFVTWVAPWTNPLVPKPAGNAYNADTHLFMSADNATMYLAYRERGVAGQNHLMVMHSTDGRAWTSPVPILSGAVGTQDFGSPSIWWNGTGWTLISHNLDAAAPWPVQRRVSSTADIYGAWGGASTVSIAPPSGRAWWHSFFTRTASGQVLGFMQDNNQTSGSSGTVYLVESGNDGAGFGGARQIYSQAGKYRSTFCLEKGADDAIRLRAVINRFDNLTLETFVLEPLTLRNDEIIARAVSLIGAAQHSLGSTVRWADTFKRADSSTTVGTADSGGSYTVSSGTWGISGNAAYPVATGRLFADVGVSAYRAGVQFSDMTTGIQQWFVFRGVDDYNYWRIGVQTPGASGSSPLLLQNIVDGGYGLNTPIGEISRGQHLSVDVTPGGFKVFVDGILIHTRTAGDHGFATKIGIQANAGASSKFRHLTCEAL